MPGARLYVLLVLALCGGVMVPVVVLNMLLSGNNLRFDKNRLASEWQQLRHGVTYAPPIRSNRSFKTLRLHDRLPEINTVIFGSSTVMSIRPEMLPPALAPYNFAQSGNGLLSVIGEAEYIAGHWGGTVKYFLIPLDWVLGFLYKQGDPVPADLSRDAVIWSAPEYGFNARLRDALSLPRVMELGRVLREVLRAPDSSAAFRQFFTEPAGEEYQCPDGTPARDFDTTFHGMCVGFRYDGSATFADQKRVIPHEIRSVLLTAAGPSSQYSKALNTSHGQINPAILERLALLARRVKANGGTVILILPPLVPGLEQALAASGHASETLARTKAALDKWSRRESIILFDAGTSEKFGCLPHEFIDPHHAMPECYRKAFTRLFLDHPRIWRR